MYNDNEKIRKLIAGNLLKIGAVFLRPDAITASH